jgi:hypothetical protein
VVGIAALKARAAGPADGETAPVFGIKIPPGYRDWRVISVAHEAATSMIFVLFWATT